MNDQNQLNIPESFVALYTAPGAYKPGLPKEALFERYEFCEDLANLMTEHAANIKFDTGIDEQDVLERCRAGLLTANSGVEQVEAEWVIGRLAELMNWQGLTTPITDLPDDDTSSEEQDDDDEDG